MMFKWSTEIGPERVGGLITLIAAVINLGRELSVLADGLTHILEMELAGLQKIHTVIFSTTSTQSAAQDDADS